MGKYVEVDRTIETALLLLEEGEDEQTLAYNAALVAFIKNMENVPAADVVDRKALKEIKQIIDTPNTAVQEDVLKYKMICEVVDRWLTQR